MSSDERVVVDDAGVAWTCTERTDRVPRVRDSVRVACHSDLAELLLVVPTGWRAWSNEELLARIAAACERKTGEDADP